MAIGLKTILLTFIVTVGTLCLRNYMRGCRYGEKTRLDDKVAIVTGANTGIGKETALDLARRGARVVLACRSVERGEKAAGDIRHRVGSHVQVIVMKLDLSSLESVRRFVDDFKRRENKLHILINNAGVIMPDRQETQDGFELQFGVNHLGHFLLTNSLLDALKAAAPSRIINVSSGAHQWQNFDFDDVMSKRSYGMLTVYGNTKLANIWFTLELSKRLKDTGVTAYSLHPGSVVTDISRNWPILKYKIVRKILAPVGWLLVKTVEEGAQTTITCAVSPALEKVTGKYFSECVETAPSEEAQNEENAHKLWVLSERYVGLSQKHSS